MATMSIQNMSFKVGQTLTIVGKPMPDATNFAVNIGHNQNDITMHINPRFNAHGDENKVVCNSFQEGKWCEEQRGESFPFKQGEEFKFTITFTASEFQVNMSDSSTITFPNRIGAEKYSYFNFDGDARITSIKIQ